jgi:hydroxymethylbilane synthase
VNLRIGTRGSALALWQAEDVKRRIRVLSGAPEVELVIIKTRGDLDTQSPLWASEGKGFFTAELDKALLENEVDLVVHSLKDLTTTLAPGIALTAVLEREDPRDALLTRDGKDLTGLAKGARIGTSSLRRRAFIARLRPDLQHLELRGNVPTRVRKLEEGAYDAVILATAGLKRLGMAGRITASLSTDDFPPAIAQGAIAVCTREGDAATAPWVAALDHAGTRAAVGAERALLRQLEGGCQVPVGGIAVASGGTVTLSAAVCSLDGKDFMRAQATSPAGAVTELGQSVAADLLEKGAWRILEAVRERRRAASAS